MRIKRDNGADVRKKIIENRDEQLKGGRGRANVIERELFEEYPDEDKEITPMKNPLRETKELTPKMLRSIYGQILNEEYPIPSNDAELESLLEAERFSTSFKTKKEMTNYIETITEGHVPSKFNKSQLADIVIVFRYKNSQKRGMV